MTKIEDRYWIERESSVHPFIPNKSDTTYDIKGTRFSYFHAPHTQNPHNPSLPRFEVLPHAQTFCSKPEPLYVTQYADLFVTWIDNNQSLIQKRMNIFRGN